MLHEKGNIDFENLNFEKEIPESRRGAGAGYCNSKLANGLFAWELSKQLEDTDVSVFALCPGWVYTGLFRNSRIPWYGYVAMLPIAFLFMRGPKSVSFCIFQFLNYFKISRVACADSEVGFVRQEGDTNPKRLRSLADTL